MPHVKMFFVFRAQEETVGSKKTDEFRCIIISAYQILSNLHVRCEASWTGRCSWWDIHLDLQLLFGHVQCNSSISHLWDLAVDVMVSLFVLLSPKKCNNFIWQNSHQPPMRFGPNRRPLHDQNSTNKLLESSWIQTKWRTVWWVFGHSIPQFWRYDSSVPSAPPGHANCRRCHLYPWAPRHLLAPEMGNI